MNRHAFSLLEMLAYLAALTVLAPVLAQLCSETLSDRGALTRHQGLVLDRHCETLRRATARGWRIAGDRLLIDSRHWQDGDGAILRDGAVAVRQCALRWRVTEAGWLRLTLDPEEGPERVILAAPARERRP